MIQYVKPEMDVMYFQETDVITTSGDQLTNQTDESKEDSGSAGDLWGWIG